jgi:hypothetical protein
MHTSSSVQPPNWRPWSLVSANSSWTEPSAAASDRSTSWNRHSRSRWWVFGLVAVVAVEVAPHLVAVGEDRGLVEEAVLDVEPALVLQAHGGEPGGVDDRGPGPDRGAGLVLADAVGQRGAEHLGARGGDSGIAAGAGGRRQFPGVAAAAAGGVRPTRIGLEVGAVDRLDRADVDLVERVGRVEGVTVQVALEVELEAPLDDRAVGLRRDGRDHRVAGAGHRHELRVGVAGDPPGHRGGVDLRGRATGRTRRRPRPRSGARRPRCG